MSKHGNMKLDHLLFLDCPLVARDGHRSSSDRRDGAEAMPSPDTEAWPILYNDDFSSDGTRH